MRTRSLLALVAMVVLMVTTLAGAPRPSEGSDLCIVDEFPVCAGKVTLAVPRSGHRVVLIGLRNGDGDQYSCVAFDRRRWAAFIRYYNRAIANWTSGGVGIFRMGGVLEFQNSRQTSLTVYLSTKNDLVLMGFAMLDPEYAESTVTLLDSEDCARFSHDVGRINELNGW